MLPASAIYLIVNQESLKLVFIVCAARLRLMAKLSGLAKDRPILGKNERGAFWAPLIPLNIHIRFRLPGHCLKSGVSFSS
jgi:hypothetical protein